MNLPCFYLLHVTYVLLLVFWPFLPSLVPVVIVYELLNQCQSLRDLCSHQVSRQREDSTLDFHGIYAT